MQVLWKMSTRQMEEKEMLRKMLVDMIEAFVGMISASFRARKIAPFFIRAQSRSRYMTPSRSYRLYQYFSLWFVFHKKRTNSNNFHIRYSCTISTAVLIHSCNTFVLEFYTIRRKKITILTIIINNNRIPLLFAISWNIKQSHYYNISFFRLLYFFLRYETSTKIGRRNQIIFFGYI